MARRINRKRILLLGVTTAIVLVAIVFQIFFGIPEKTLPSVAPGTVEIHAIDVGQADCTLIRTEAGHILIDAGDVATGKDVVDYLRRAGVERLAYAIFTHPDSDHIGGACDVLLAVEVERVILPKIHESDIPKTEVYTQLMSAVLAEPDVHVIAAASGDTYELGELQMRVLAPNASDYADINDYSVAVRLDFGETSFLFTGDAQATSEQEMLAIQPVEVLDCTFFQAGHHGANTSNTVAFLEAVSPEIVVISCGENSFGHPSGEALVAYACVGAAVYRTDEMGTMVFVSDGKQIVKK